MKHCSTSEQRSLWVSTLLAHPEHHGLLSQCSRNHQVARQTLYRWKAKGQQALQQALHPEGHPSKRTIQVERAVLTLLIQAHASYRGIQTCLKELFGLQVSLGTITAIIQQAGERAQVWLEQQVPNQARALALDEQYSSKRGEAYLNVVDVQSSLVWATLPPVPVDGESWTLVLWQLAEQGVQVESTVSDGGKAIADALDTTQGLNTHQRDVWHLLHLASAVQGRVDRWLGQLEDQWLTVQRQAQRIAAGKKALGARPATDVEAHCQQRSLARRIAEGLQYLLMELRRLLQVVVLPSRIVGGIMNSQRRQQEIEALLDLLQELSEQAPSAIEKEISKLHRQWQLALPSLLLFARFLDPLEQQATEVLGAQAVRLIAWAWLHRQILGPSSATLLAQLPPAWRPVAEQLLAGWNQAVRASSVVENWHSILRPHLAVHRRLSAGMLALLALWHNHLVAPRGVHAGLSPLQRSGMSQQTTDWLSVLGYEPFAA